MHYGAGRGKNNIESVDGSLEAYVRARIRAYDKQNKGLLTEMERYKKQLQKAAAWIQDADGELKSLRACNDSLLREKQGIKRLSKEKEDSVTVSREMYQKSLTDQTRERTRVLTAQVKDLEEKLAQCKCKNKITEQDEELEGHGRRGAADGWTYRPIGNWSRR